MAYRTRMVVVWTGRVTRTRAESDLWSTPKSKSMVANNIVNKRSQFAAKDSRPRRVSSKSVKVVENTTVFEASVRKEIGGTSVLRFT